MWFSIDFFPIINHPAGDPPMTAVPHHGRTIGHLVRLSLALQTRRRGVRTGHGRACHGMVLRHKMKSVLVTEKKWNHQYIRIIIYIILYNYVYIIVIICDMIYGDFANVQVIFIEAIATAIYARPIWFLDVFGVLCAFNISYWSTTSSKKRAPWNNGCCAFQSQIVHHLSQWKSCDQRPRRGSTLTLVLWTGQQRTEYVQMFI